MNEIKTLVIPDTHVEEKCLPECERIFQEIYDRALQYKVDRIIHLGDFFNNKKLSPKEVEFGIRWTLKFRILVKDKFYIIVGNHCEIDTKTNTVFYLSFIGANIADEFVFENIYYGHCMTEESLLPHKEAGTSKYEKLSKDLDSYSFYVLGHQHLFQTLKKGIHLGSARYCSFGELKDQEKQIAIVYTKKDSYLYELIPLKNPTSMYQVSKVEDLDKIPSNSKVRIVYKDFTRYKNEVNELGQYKKKFEDFKIKLDFTKFIKKEEQSTSTLREIIKNWINNIKDKHVKTELINVFKENNY